MQRPLVQAVAQRLLAGQHERDTVFGELGPGDRERQQFAVDGRHEHVDPLADAELDDLGHERLVVAPRHDHAVVRIDEVQAGGVGVDIGAVDVPGIVGQRLHEGDAGRAAGAGDQDARTRAAGSHSATAASSVDRTASAGVSLPESLSRTTSNGSTYLERREAAPVAGGGAQQVRLEIVAHRDLRSVGLDRLELALQEAVDRHEPRRTELDRRRWRLIAVDPLDPARGDQGRVMHVAVVLVHVASRVGVDRGGLDLVDHPLDRRRSCRRLR